MMETIDKIIETTGRKVSVCSCTHCQDQCKRTPCLGTPDDMLKLIEAGYAERLSPTMWAAGMIMRVHPEPVALIAPKYDSKKGACTFFKDGLCELHDKGLKPTEGRLSYHDMTIKNDVGPKNVTWQVAKEWLLVMDPAKVNKILFAFKKLLNL